MLQRDSIRYRPYSTDDIQLEIAFLGQVMAVWMESRGVLMFHAGAVALDGHAIGFMGQNGAGKSTLTSMLVSDGADLITDDVLAIAHSDDRYQAWPSYPSMRMWPETARLVGVDYEPLVRVHPMLEKRYVPVGTGIFGTFMGRPLPLERIYVLGKRCEGDSASIEPLLSGEAVYELAQHTFARRKLHLMGATAQRFNALAALASTCCVKRISVPAGIEQLPGIKQSILRDLAGNPRD